MFKDGIPFQERKEESARVMAKYRDRVPIIIERASPSTPSISKRKFLVPEDLLCSQLFYVIRKRLRMPPDKALFFYYDDKTLVSATMPVREAFQKRRDVDGFLYITFSVENTFGHVPHPLHD